MPGVTLQLSNLHPSSSAGLVAHGGASSSSPSRMSSCSAFVSCPLRPQAASSKSRSSVGSRVAEFDGRAVVCRLREGDFSALSSPSSSRLSSEDFVRGFSGGSVGQKLGQKGHSRGRGRRENGVVTTALPIDAYWITAAQAFAVAGLMGGFAVVSGVLINIRIEVQALAEYKDLKEKGLLPDIVVPEGEFDLESPLYIFQNKELSSAGTSRNRPIREEVQQPELENELKTELVEAASKE